MAKKNIPIAARERARWGLFGLPFTFTVYTITDKKLIIKTGFLSRQYDETLLYRITDLRMENTIWQALFGFGLGTVTVYSKDSTNPKLVIKNIRHYRDFYETLSTKIEQERLRYGVRSSELIDGGADHFGDHDANHGGIDGNHNGIPDDIEFGGHDDAAY